MLDNKATNTHSELVTLLFHGNNCYTNTHTHPHTLTHTPHTHTHTTPTHTPHTHTHCAYTIQGEMVAEFGSHRLYVFQRLY